MRRNPWPRVTVLAGFRWVNLSEEIEGILCLPHARGGDFLGHPDGEQSLRFSDWGGRQAARARPLFDGRRAEGGGLRQSGRGDNLVRIYRIQFGESCATDHAAFVGETGLRCKYQVTPRLSLRAGYEAIWLQGVALAPGQIPETYSHDALLPQDVYVQARGINFSCGVFYHGATAGLEYSF